VGKIIDNKENTMAEPLWTPSASRIENAQITRFTTYVNERYDLALSGFDALYQWSVDSDEDFWSAVWDFCEVVASQRGDAVLADGDKFPGAKWFPEARLNFAENMLRYRDDQIALVSLLENGARQEISYADLYTRVAQLAASLRAERVVAGDRVAGLMPNIAETVIAMLATTSIGAIWSSCSPDFGINGVMDRFGQIQPKVLFSADGYYYNGKTCDSLERLATIVERIDSLQKVVVVPVVSEQADIAGLGKAVLFDDYLDVSVSECQFEQLPFDHPLYIMYSSGTTGMPKCIVHGAGGTLLQHLKEHQLLVDMSRDDVFFYFTTCGWMMWNWLVSGLATGATLVLYDGSPFARRGKVLLDAIDAEGISIFGVGAKYIAALEKQKLIPRQSHKLECLKAVLSTGSPLSHESFEYVYRDIKDDVCLSSISGGTDILSCFVGGCPVLPVYTGEIQARGLGMAVDIWNDEGQPVTEEKGELVCTKPFPCAPIGFWNDDDGAKYHDAYFDAWPNIWAHGDYGEITEHGGIVIHGRSDAVLNPGGVRIGTAEIYRQVEKLEEIQESIVIGQEWGDDVRVVLFVVLTENVELDEALKVRIKTVIRENTTPRHVPAKIIAVTDIPRTISGKIVELAVRNVVHDRPVKNTDALANPEVLDLYRDIPTLQV
jgi:acetoacetyl-CoA synthetase